jgi:hypothetical protein
LLDDALANLAPHPVHCEESAGLALAIAYRLEPGDAACRVESARNWRAHLQAGWPITTWNQVETSKRSDHLAADGYASIGMPNVSNGRDDWQDLPGSPVNERVE